MGRPNAFDGMMHEFCVGLGWCGCVQHGKPLHVTDFIPETGDVSAEQFVSWLILADGINPEEQTPQVKRWKRDLTAVFIKHMKSEIVDAKVLHSDFIGA